MSVAPPVTFDSAVTTEALEEPSRATTPRWVRRERFGAPPAVIGFAVVAALAATIWSAETHSMLLYGDARAHLNVARHVTDGLRPGPTQLGSVWLPMPHILLVPLTAWRLLWHSGGAGAIVSGGCFVYAAVRVFSLVEELTNNRLAAWAGFVVFAVNLNLLYVQTTALTEPVLLAYFVGATYHLARWMRTLSTRDLMWAALLTMFATLTRYEGWAYLLAGGAVVILWGLLVDRRRGSREANIVLYTVLGAYGILLWFVYNLTIFHDVLYFLRSTYSAQVINGALAQLAGTKGNLIASAVTYGWDVVGVVGPLATGAAAISAVVLLLVRHPERRRTAFVLALLFAPIGFEVLSLYLGQTTIRIPQRAPHGMWNDRYGLMALPFCAVAIAALLSRRRVLGVLAAGTAAVGLVAAAFATPLTLADGRTGTSSATAGRRETAARYLHARYHGGAVLADDSAASAFIFAADLNLKEFVTPGFHPFWEHALTAPARHVRWVVAFPGDAISADLSRHSDRFARFQLVLTDGDIRIYTRRSRSTAPASVPRTFPTTPATAPLAPRSNASLGGAPRTLPLAPPLPSMARAVPPATWMLIVQTLPAVPGAKFSFAGTTFVSDPVTGLAQLLIAQDEHRRLMADGAYQLSLLTPTVPLGGSRAIFTGWSGPGTFSYGIETEVATFELVR